MASSSVFRAEWMDKAYPPLPPPQGAPMPAELELGALSQGGFWTAVEGLICIYANGAWLITFPSPIQADPGAVGSVPDPMLKLAS